MQVDLQSFLTFKASAEFDDCVITNGEIEIITSKLILSRFSSFFKNYFCSLGNLSSSERVVFKLDNVCSRTLTSLFNLILHGTQEVVIDDIPDLLVLSHRLECDLITQILSKFMIDNVTPSNVLQLLNNFIQCGITPETMLLVPFFTDLLKISILKHTNLFSTSFNAYEMYLSDQKMPIYTLDMLFRSVPSVEFLASVLESDDLYVYQLKNPYVHVKEHKDRLVFCTEREEKKTFLLRIIEMFTKMHTIQKMDDRIILEKLINFSDTDFSILSKYALSWLTPRTARRLLTLSLRAKRLTIKSFEEAGSKCSENISSMFVFSWLTAIQNSVIIQDELSPSVKLIEFVSTMGGHLQPIDLQKYGFVSLENTGEPLNNVIYSTGNALTADPDEYFVSYSKTGIIPGLALRLLRNTSFRISKIEVALETQRRTLYNTSDSVKRPVQKALELRYEEEGNQVVRVSKVESGRCVFVTGPSLSKPIREFKILVGPSDRQHLSVLRISNIEVHGVFSP